MDTMALKSRRRIVGLVTLVTFTMGLGACRQAEQKKDEQRQHVESMMAILLQVQKNLGRIRQKEAVVERLSSDIEGRQEVNADKIGREIYGNIRYLDSTLTASKALVTKMENDNRSSGYRVETLDRLTRELKSDLEARGREIAAMKAEIAKLNSEVSRLMSTVDVMDEVISEQEDRMSTAYYIVGTVDQLAGKGVLVKPGPLAKLLGGGPVIANDYDTKVFRQIDVTETTDVFIDKPVRGLHLLTPHTKGSYELVGGSTSALLLIKDPDEFWKKSRCLIILRE
ncbi:MAG: hypothetical protein HGB29_07860 [Chlorobiaceae bacterium]|nr:hypothetical protein [Chlorobiaceae bacterium]NTW74762.1 hypothetical protein [Chlorobiaceae bacterium]